MPTSASPSASFSSAGGAGKQRTRNAQAQADLRVRRKNYIKTLEDTVLSLEACVRQLRAQNAELTRRTSTSFDLASSSSNVVDADEKEAFRRDEEWQELKAENARLYAILAKAGLIDETSGREDVAESSTCSTLKKATPSFASSKEGKTWSSTCFITTKKHKLSKMQEFAQQVDSQLSGVGPDSSSSFTTTSPPQEVNYQAQQAYPPFTDKNVFYLPDPAVGLDVSVGDTPSSSRSSRGESVTSHRSPKTPRFESTLQDDKEMLDSTLAFDASSSAPMSVQAQAAWYETPIVLAPVSTASMGSAQVFAQEPSLLPLPQQVDAWMIRQLSTSAPPSTVNVWPLPFQASEYSSSASIRFARHPFFCCCDRVRSRHAQVLAFPFCSGTCYPSLTKSFSHPPPRFDDYRCSTLLGYPTSLLNNISSGSVMGKLSFALKNGMGWDGMGASKRG